MTNISKNIKIKTSIAATRNRRKSQICKVYNVKIDTSNLPKSQLTQLKMMFVEAKWIANDIISKSKQGLSVFDYKPSDIIQHKDKDMNTISAELKYLGSHMKQSVCDEIKTNIKALSRLKQKGYKIG